MRIAIFTDTFYPQIDGVVTSTISLAKELADRGHKIFIFAPKPKIDHEFRYPGIKVIRIRGIPAPFYPGFKITTPIGLNAISYLKRNKIQVIHMQTPATMGMSAIVCSMILRLPLVGTFHTRVAHPMYRKHLFLNHWIFEGLAWNYLKRYYNRCDLITCPSQTTKNELDSHHFKPRKIIISNGIHLGSRVSDSVKNIKGNLLYVGRIAYEKNIFFLLNCFKKIIDRMPKTKMYIVGDGPQIGKLRDKIIQMKLEDNIFLTGFMNHEELMHSDIYKKCEVFVTASTTETQGITLLEAQVRGLVGVGMNEGGTSELIKDGESGFLIKPGDSTAFAEKVVSLLKNKKLYNRLRRRSLEELKKHDFKRVVSTWEEEYSKLVDQYEKK